MNPGFFSDINYSSANEDGRTEREALAPAINGGQVLCITGSGARPLDLLMAGPERIVSIDFNPTQNHLLALKIAAFRNLEYEDLLSFLGVTPDAHRLRTYGLLRSALGAEARAFWDHHPDRIAAGVLYCGRWEGYLRTMARAFEVVHGDALRAILCSTDLDGQHRRWRAATRTWTWRLLMRVVSARPIWRHVVREPGIELIPDRVDVARVLEGRLEAAARRHLFRACAFGSLILTGRYVTGALPCHLERRHFGMVRERLASIEVRTASLAEELKATSDRFDAFSVSDFGSYAPPAVYGAIWAGMRRTARPGARVCERLFLVPRAPERMAGGAMTRDTAAEAHATATDRSFVYRYVVGTLG